MKTLDQGFGAIGLLLLAAALSLLLTIGIPISVSRDSIELKDWLGFAGNVLGAFVALLAAIVAWQAVQRQISVQREANLLDILTREEDRIENDVRACDAVIELMWDACLILTEGDRRRPSMMNDGLIKLGISANQVLTRTLVQSKLPPISSAHIGTTTVIALSQVKKALEDCVKFEYRRDESFAGLRATLQEKLAEEASKSILFAVNRLSDEISMLNQERNQLSKTAQRYRERIATALTEFDTVTKLKPPHSPQ